MKTLLAGIFLLAAVPAIALAQDHGPAAPSIALRPEVTVQHATVRLRDIAVMTGGSALWRQSAGQVEVLRLQAGQETVELNVQAVRANLRRFAGVSLPDNAWSGPGSVSVSWGGTQLDAERLLASANAAMVRVLGDQGTRLDVRPTVQIRSLLVPQGELSLVTHAAVWRPGQQLTRVDVDVSVAGRKVARVPVWFEVRAREASRIGSRQVDGAQPWVRRQSQVVLEVRQADILVEAVATALADGDDGDVIAVRLPTTRGISSARVVAPGRVLLQGRT